MQEHFKERGKSLKNEYHIIYYKRGRDGEAAQRICKSKGNRIEMDREKTKKLGMGKKRRKKKVTDSGFFSVRKTGGESTLNQRTISAQILKCLYHKQCADLRQTLR